MFTLPDLPYSYNALEPFIDEETMHFHHDKHHATYVDNLNKALEGEDKFLNMDILELLKNLDLVPVEIKTKVKNNAGGVFNHNFFWVIMSTQDKSKESGEKIRGGQLLAAINEAFGSLEKFKEQFSLAALNHFGSGWAWLVLGDKGLEIIDTANQDSPITLGYKPVLAIDVWEHAYYLKYQNRRKDYIEAWWNVVNWEKVEQNFNSAKS